MASQTGREPAELERTGSDGGRDGPGPDDGPRPDGRSDPEGSATGPGWLDRTWYRSRVGIAVIAGDLLLTAVLVAAATLAYDGPLLGVAGLSTGIVPPYVPVFSLLGALGFVFTTLIERFDGSTGRLLRYNFRLLAALPLGIGVFLLSDVVLAEAASNDALVAGTVFLAGLYVNLAYKRLGALARRLLPGERSDRSSSSEDDGRSSSSSEGQSPG
ncbi:hypothetical protein SAMN04488066_12028 [Halorubrum aquaticum]|uniref:Uncharacterized protein n=1 Tax=Halorubrum aquaticum TaxID=387340 RepID=A0A1I3C9A1_9EURY|nr:hypothetical protein [Halorubrum aquaticum]SFH70906.1 hypothetical protein SAMN04488066_12028 [Halorubrum aquaticum]